jgi:uncharacterized protein
MRLISHGLVCAALAVGLNACSSANADAVATAQVSDASCDGIDIPNLRGRVTDAAAMLSAAEERSLAERLARYEIASGTQAVIVTVAELEGRTVQSVATCVGNRWGIGDARRNDGILILLAARERQVRVALGSGISNADNDPTASAIIAAMTPHFADGAMAHGLDSGIAVLERQYP